MKQITMIIRPEKLEQVKKVIDLGGCNGMTIMSVMGCGAQKGAADGSTVFHGMTTTINLLPKILVLAVVADDVLDELVLKLEDEIRTGNVGDGKIFITNIEDAVRIRTGEHGNPAL